MIDSNVITAGAAVIGAVVVRLIETRFNPKAAKAVKESEALRKKLAQEAEILRKDLRNELEREREENERLRLEVEEWRKRYWESQVDSDEYPNTAPSGSY